MSTVHQFPVQRNQPPAAPEEVADARGVAIDAAVGADASFEARDRDHAPAVATMARRSIVAHRGRGIVE